MNHTVNPEALHEQVKPLHPLLSDPDLWEIMIDGHERVLVERYGRLEQVESPFTTQADLQALIDGLFGLYGIKLDASNPVGHLRLPDHSRVMAIVPPNAVNGPYLVLRRIIGQRLTWEQLFEFGFLPPSAYELLKDAVEARANILVAGGTNSGKTTLAGLIADLASPEERLVAVEHSYELQLDHPRAVRLEAGGPAGLSFAEVLTAATHMRPDRLIVGNIDGPDAASVLQQFGSGIDGSLTNIHSTSATDALSRLESFCLMSNLGLGLHEIRHLIAAGIQLITYEEQLRSGKRKIMEIVELHGVENHHYLLQPLMHYDQEAEQFEFTGVQPSWAR